MDMNDDSFSVAPPPAVLLTPGRTRNIAQDMEALRLSRQDNPYLQQVIASRESLIESHQDDCQSDDTILMSQDWGSCGLVLSEDPITLREVHDHLVRSPPPVVSWPNHHDSVSLGCNGRAASAFDFGSAPHSYSALAVDCHDKDWNNGYRSGRRGPRSELERCANASANYNRSRSSRSVSPRSHDSVRPLSLPVESHLRLTLSRPLRGRAPHQTEDSERLVPQ